MNSCRDNAASSKPFIFPEGNVEMDDSSASTRGRRIRYVTGRETREEKLTRSSLYPLHSVERTLEHISVFGDRSS